MKNDNKRALWLIIPNAFCAVIWAIIAVDDVITGSSTAKLVFHSLCVVIWLILAIQNYRRFGKEKNNVGKQNKR